jgi:catechol 2,3-dioxygenase-like lactoylglutathione lyase family enzyme
MPVEKVRYTYLVVDDMNAAVAFYRDGLGLRLKFQDGQRWSEFEAGNGTTIALSSYDESGLGVKGPVVVFQVSDAERLAASLVARGADILARRDMGRSWAPDRNPRTLRKHLSAFRETSLLHLSGGSLFDALISLAGSWLQIGGIVRQPGSTSGTRPPSSFTRTRVFSL